MGVFTSETEATSAIPPARLFKALILDGDNIIPKVATQYIKSVEIIQGNGGPGTIKKITFGEGSPFKYMKHEVVTLDQASLTYGYTLTEGDPLSDELEKITCETKIVASPDGGSVFKSISHYHTKGNHEMKEEQVKAGNERSVGLFKAVEAYLVAHPDEYN